MKQLVSWNGWPNGIDPPTLADAVQAAYSMLAFPAPGDFRSSTERAKAKLMFVGEEVRLAILRSPVLRDQSISFFNPVNHILGIQVVEDLDLPSNVYQFRDTDGNVLHTGILSGDE